MLISDLGAAADAGTLQDSEAVLSRSLLELDQRMEEAQPPARAHALSGAGDRRRQRGPPRRRRLGRGLPDRAGDPALQARADHPDELSSPHDAAHAWLGLILWQAGALPRLHEVFRSSNRSTVEDRYRRRGEVCTYLRRATLGRCGSMATLFDDPCARAALTDALRAQLAAAGVEVEERDLLIEDTSPSSSSGASCSTSSVRPRATARTHLSGSKSRRPGGSS